MSKYFLIEVSPEGKHSELSSSDESESLIKTGEELKKRNPEMLFAVIDDFDLFVWPEDIIKINR